MKAVIFFFLCTLFTLPTVFGQIKIGDNPQNIDDASVLELESSSKVLVITRVTTAQMETIAPQRGGMVYNTDTACIHYFDGAQWINLCDAVSFEITNDPIINNRSTIEITQSEGGYNLEVAKNSILGDNIVDGGIGPDDIQDNSIGQEKLAAESVGSSELRENSVGSEELRDGTIVPTDIANTDPGRVLTTDENGIVQWEDANEIYELTFNKIDTTLSIFRSTTPGANSVNLAGLIGSDDQILTLTPELMLQIEDGNAIDLSVLNNSGTDEQTLATTTAPGNISISNGNAITLNVNDADADLTNEIQNIEEVLTDGNNAGGNLIKNLGNPIDNQDAVTKAYVDGAITGVGGTIVSTQPNNDISNNGGAFYDDPDDDASNELQDLAFNPITNILTVTNPGTPDNEADLTSLIQNFQNSATVNISGDGTAANPYVFDAPGNVANGAETIINGGANIMVTGNGTTATPYVITAADAVGDGSETQLDEGTNIMITGTGTDAEPYIINAADDQNAAEVIYDNTTSGLAAATTQAAIDELAALPAGSDSQNLTNVLTQGNNAGSNVIIGLGISLDPTSAATRGYVDANLGGTQDLEAVLGNGTSAGNNQINDLLDPSLPQDAATKKYVDDNIVTAGGGVPTDELNQTFVVNGLNLELTDAGGTLQVPLADINTNTTNLSLTEDGTNLILTDSDANAVTIPLGDIDTDTNTTNASLTEDGTNLILTDSEANTVTIPLAAIDTDTNTTNASFTEDGTNLILTDSDANTVTIPLGDIDTDTNTTNSSLTEDGTNLILTDSDANTVTIPLADISSGIDTNTTNVSLTEDGTNLILTDSEANTVTIPLGDIDTDTNTTNASFTEDGTNLILTDSDANTVTIPLGDIDTDTNTTNASLTEDGTNLVLTDSEANTVTIPLADINSGIDTNTVNTSLTEDGTNLILTDSDANTVTIPLADISSGIDTNTTNVSLTEDGTDLILEDSDGNLVSIPIATLIAAIDTDTNTTNTSLTEDGTNLILEDSDGGAVTIALADIASSADTNTTNVSLTEDGTDLILEDSDGNLVSIPIATLIAAIDTDTNTTNTSLTEDGTNLILEDSDGGTLTIALADIASGADTNTTNVSLTEDGTDLILEDSDGGTVTIALADIALGADTNTTNVSLTADGTDLTLSDSEGDIVQIALAEITHSGTPGSLFFADTNGTPTENNAQLFWDAANDRLGIGTSNPQNKLHVTGEVRSQGYSNSNGTPNEPAYSFTNDSNTGMFRGVIGGGNAPVNWLRFATGGNEAITINPSQDVGIGPNFANDPIAARLHVNGNIRAEGAIEASGNIAGGIPDYVFQKYFTGASNLNDAYIFQNLNEIENFVKQNNHLPGIKSAAAIKAQGFWDLGEASRINLEKIEELFLHTIEQEKKIEALQEENSELAKQMDALQLQVAEIKKLLAKGNE